MALSRLVLKNGLLGLFESGNYPENTREAGVNFSNVIDIYSVSIIPTSVSFAEAKSMFVSAFLGAEWKQSMEVFVDAVEAYCRTLATGMAVPGFKGIPPVGRALLSKQMEGLGVLSLSGCSVEEWCENASMAIDGYFRTGTFLNVATGIAVPWS